MKKEEFCLQQTYGAEFAKQLVPQVSDNAQELVVYAFDKEAVIGNFIFDGDNAWFVSWVDGNVLHTVNSQAEAEDYIKTYGRSVKDYYGQP